MTEGRDFFFAADPVFPGGVLRERQTRLRIFFFFRCMQNEAWMRETGGRGGSIFRLSGMILSAQSSLSARTGA